MSTEARDHVWEFLRECTVHHNHSALPFTVFIRVLHGWSGSNGYDLPRQNEAESALADARYPLVTSRRGNLIIPGLRLIPRDPPQ